MFPSILEYYSNDEIFDYLTSIEYFIDNCLLNDDNFLRLISLYCKLHKEYIQRLSNSEGRDIEHDFK